MKTWKDCVAFHGHECGGLTIGWKASLYAIKLLELEFSEDEQVVCIAENDACGVDAIQVMLGCSIGKGNLLFHMRGKQAFSFYNRKNGKSVRLVLKPGSGRCPGRSPLAITSPAARRRCLRSRKPPFACRKRHGSSIRTPATAAARSRAQTGSAWQVAKSCAWTATTAMTVSVCDRRRSKEKTTGLPAMPLS